MILGKWIESLADQAQLDEILLKDYKFVLLDMFKGNVDASLDDKFLEAFERSLNLPPDYKLLPESWVSAVAVRIPISLPSALLKHSLEYCLYLGVNSIILSGFFSYRVDQLLPFLTDFIAQNHSQVSIMFGCSAGDLEAWSRLWRTTKAFTCHTKAALLVDGESTNGLISRWSCEALGLVMCNKAPTDLILSWSLPIVNMSADKFHLLPKECNDDLYDEVLQIPLRPLFDNLPSSTYAAFESDPIKYQKYDDAIRKALRDLSAKDRLAVAVLGAGRGPLVDILLKALPDCHHTKIYVVDKNPHVFVTLLKKKRSLPEWKDVELVFADMREWKPNVSIDLIITELLGSFGDNELSPECLDSVQQHLSQPDGIIIPQTYTSWIEPIHAPRLHRKVLIESQVDPLAFEKTFVCKIKDALFPATVSKPFLTFCHPRDLSVDTNKSLQIPFNIEMDGCYLDGFVGYFSAILYDDVSISTRRDDPELTLQMFSWFPLFFPQAKPVKLAKGSQVILEISRSAQDDQVQYNWNATCVNT